MGKRFVNKQLVSHYAVWLPILAGAASGAAVLGRELWFDEALTVTNFMLPLSWDQIYRSYVIPNNQIVYTLALKLWHTLFTQNAADPAAFWRLLSLGAALAAVAVIWNLRKLIQKGSRWPQTAVLTLFALSPLFQNYATALRGYALSWLWVALALAGAWLIFQTERRKQGWALYGFAALAAVGTVPTNLLALGGVVLYALPWSRRDFLRDRRLWGLALTPFLALALFYGPIFPAFFHTFTLNEGFAGRWRALAVIYGAFAATFGVVLAAEFFRFRTARDWRERLRTAVWLLPVPAVLLLHQAPFPRVFCTLLPVLILLLSDGLGAIAWNRVKVWGAVVLVLAVQFPLRRAVPMLAERSALSCYEDDYFQPWYMAHDYSVRALLPELRRHPEARTVFLSFNSDPCPILFYAALEDLRRDFRPDLPAGRVGSLPAGAWLILRRDDDPAVFARRFGRTLLPAARCGDWRIFRLR